ncbi:hypothetical protein XFF4834R_chr16300 [Xanthomonas citri pv. fuscans]|nr:hypothetical protein XFF4834R_chr16300 [Xanthomonas citri pv. fuscans]
MPEGPADVPERARLARGEPSAAKSCRLGDMDASGDEGLEEVVCAVALFG